jgi:hypothetical protein
MASVKTLPKALEQILDLAGSIVHTITRKHLNLRATIREELYLPSLAGHDHQHHDGIIAVLLYRKVDVFTSKPIQKVDQSLHEKAKSRSVKRGSTA